MKLFRRKKKYRVWGIRVPLEIQKRWTFLAEVMRIPTNRLVMFVLKDWTRQNGQKLLDRTTRISLADSITRAYLKGELDK